MRWAQALMGIMPLEEKRIRQCLIHRTHVRDARGDQDVLKLRGSSLVSRLS